MITIDGFKELIQQSSECHYCSRGTNFYPTKKRDPSQLTLERIDNTRAHTYLNCLICCYACNVLRADDLSSSAFRSIFSKRP